MQVLGPLAATRQAWDPAYYPGI